MSGLDRGAAGDANFGRAVSDRTAVLAARSAAEDADSQPRALPGYQGQSPWLVGLGGQRSLSAAVSRLGRPHVAAIAGWFGLVAIATGVWRNVPVIDDWTYAWTVERLLNSGTFALLDWSSAYPVGQAIWGGAWSALLGFSFVTLRLSTLVLAVAACLALYLLLRELGTSTRLSLIGALSLAVNPVFVFLSSSFMTDVPFAAFTTLALLGYVRAAGRGDPRWLWWAGLWAFAAFLFRQVGLVTPVAGLALLVVRSPQPQMTRLRIAVPLAATWAAIGVSWIALRSTFGTTSVMDRWTWNLLARPDSYVAMNGPLFVTLAFYILPALLAAASAREIWRRPIVLVGALLATMAVLTIALGELPSPLPPDSTWTLREVGASQSLVGGRFPPPPGGWPSVLARAGGVLAVTLFFVVWLDRRGALSALVAYVRAALADLGLGSFERGVAAQRPGIEASEPAETRVWALTRAPLLAYLAVHLLIVNLLWMYLDRYSLAILPPLVALTLGGSRRMIRWAQLPAAVLVVFAAIALVGTRGALDFNQAVRNTWQTLVDAGVPAADIDAGYAWNGWILYAHPWNLAPGQTPLHDVPWITSDRQLPYVIAKAPVEGYAVERSLPWRDLPWRDPDRLFVLKRQ